MKTGLETIPQACPKDRCRRRRSYILHAEQFPSTFLLPSGSESGATPHDDTHNALMTLLPYTGTRNGEGCQRGSGPKSCRVDF